jgi:hypothetical protein
MIVAKLGATENLERRTKEHLVTFSKKNNCNLELLKCVYIDPKYIFEAEN